MGEITYPFQNVIGSTVEVLAWISDYITHFVGEITYPFQNVIGSTVEVSEWVRNYIPHFIVDVMTYACCD